MKTPFRKKREGIIFVNYYYVDIKFDYFIFNCTMNKKHRWRFSACKHHITVYTFTEYHSVYFTEYHTVDVEIHKFHVAVLERNIPAPVSWLPSQVIMIAEPHLRCSKRAICVRLRPFILFFPLQDRKLYVQHNFKYRLDHMIYRSIRQSRFYFKLIKSIL